MTQINNWEVEFDLRFKNWKEDINFWKLDIKDFIQEQKTLAKAEERIRIANVLQQSSITARQVLEILKLLEIK